jgi:hypothetical protein
MGKEKLTFAERVDRARDGRTQAWIVRKMQEHGCVMSEVQFSRKKKGWDDFTEEELKALSEILNIEL